MTLRARVALWTFVTALVAAATLTALFALDARRSTIERLRAEGRRVAVSAVTLYDVLRLTGAEADKSTLRAYLRAAVRGTSTTDRLAYAIVLDDTGAFVAGDVAWDVLEEPAPAADASLADAPLADAVQRALPRPHILAVEARVLARDAAPAPRGSATEVPAGRVLVGLSNRPAEAAFSRTFLWSSALSGLAAFAFAGALFLLLTRRLVRPVARVVDGMDALRAGRLDVVVPDPGGRDEAAELSRGFNDLVTALVEKEKLKSTLQRHVGKKLAGDAADLPVGSGRRLLVTAVVLEVEGLHTRMGRSSPEETVGFLQELVAASIDVVHAHDGHVARVMGDTFLALWGVPLARPDDALRAVRCALALQERCAALSEARRVRGDEPFAVGVGVATGEAVIAAVGSSERAETVVAGEVVTLARGAEEAALAHGFGLLLAEESWRRVDTQFEGAATPPLVVDGIGVPLTLYRIRPRRRG